MTGDPDPWGRDQPRADVGALAALPPRLARLADVQATGIMAIDDDRDAHDFPTAAALPEVASLMRSGWRPLSGAPLHCLLPAAWPREHRTWVPDRMPKVGMGGTTATYWPSIVALPDDDEHWHDLYPDDEARAVGLPQPPAGRIWLLRTPWPRIPVSVILEIIWSFVQRRDTADETAAVYRVAADVLTWDEHRALQTCPTASRRLLDAWADAGRVGESAAELVEHRLMPAELEHALSRTGLDEPTLLAWLASLRAGPDEVTIDVVTDVITGWRAAGLPGDPPPQAQRYLHRDPAELRSWLDSGFDLYAAAQLELAGLATAIRWRHAGFDTADTYELLRADPTLTPEEATAFDSAGAAGERRREWVHNGFTAADAAGWAATGLTPAGARLWRACGRTAGDVRPGQRFPPQLTKGQRYMSFARDADGELSRSDWDALPDPPGTRGRRARRWAGDDDPWINTD